jgi:Rrf2 family protein
MFGPSITAAYATRALVCLARHEGGWVRGAGTIASCSGVPRPYLVKVLHALARGGLVETKRGYRGGYRLARPAEQITLFEILSAVDGADVFERCFLGLGKCSPKRGCPVHAVWSEQRKRVKNRYHELTLRELARSDTLDMGRDYRFGWPGGASRPTPGS